MKTSFILLLFTLFTNFVYSQIEGVILDSVSSKPIPYVNIWVEDENIGTTTNINGKFELEEPKFSRTIAISAIGYEARKVKYSESFNTIKLKQQIFELPEVIVQNKKTKLLKVGKYKRSKISLHQVCGGFPYMLGKYFPYDKKYSFTPFLKEVKILTRSYIKEAKFNLRLYYANEKGEPKNSILNENIYGFAKKGGKNTVVDLSNYSIPFPKNGFFIVVEWLIVEENSHEFEYFMKGSKDKKKEIRYEPSFAMEAGEQDKIAWQYAKGIWRKNSKSNWAQNKNYYKKYAVLAAELTLTN